MHFYPRPPRGGRHLCRVHVLQLDIHFYPRPPRGGRPRCFFVFAQSFVISIHALREEGDQRHYPQLPPHHHFYPRPPRGGRPYLPPSSLMHCAISIHALREEGDPALWFAKSAQGLFLSTPSARRATAVAVSRKLLIEHFYPRPPRGGRRNTAYQRAVADIFLSTPSARRATRLLHQRTTESAISIHALREEGDSITFSRRTAFCDFYPRPPRGGRRPLYNRYRHTKKFLSTPSARRATGVLYRSNPPKSIFLSTPSARRATSCTGRAAHRPNHFYPRPPRGGRHVINNAFFKMLKFLSTPSARRAT